MASVFVHEAHVVIIQNSFELRDVLICPGIKLLELPQDGVVDGGQEVDISLIHP